MLKTLMIIHSHHNKIRTGIRWVSSRNSKELLFHWFRNHFFSRFLHLKISFCQINTIPENRAVFSLLLSIPFVSFRSFTILFLLPDFLRKQSFDFVTSTYLQLTSRLYHWQKSWSSSFHFSYSVRLSHKYLWVLFYKIFSWPLSVQNEIHLCCFALGFFLK